MSIDTTPRRWKAVDRPALFPPAGSAAANNSRGWELVAINSKTATVRNRWIVGELAYDAQDVRVLDPFPWIVTEGENTGHRLPVRPPVTPTAWEPRTFEALRAAGIALGVDERSPYDTGERAQPRPWSTLRTHELHYLTGAQLTEELDRFGRVDFDDDASETIATVYVERTTDGLHRVRVFAHDSDAIVTDDNDDANASMREALSTWREAEAAYAAACEEEEETGREKEPDAYYARDDAAVEFATVAAAWIAARLGVTA